MGKGAPEARATVAAIGVTAIAIGVFLALELRHLDTIPRVYEDEPWQASVAYRLLHGGVFGSSLFAGLANMDQRYYGFMPLHPLLLALDFRLLGVGLAQARLEPVLLSAVTLALTAALGVRLFDAWVGALAVVLLVFGRWTGLTYIQLTGIPLVDLARIARYDPLVPVLGLAALHAWLSARDSGARTWYLAAGALAGLAGLAHLYGLFWIPALLLLTWLEGRRARGKLPWLVAGAVVPWLPYLGYVLTDLPDWRAQTATYAERFGLLDPRWYLTNVLNEYHRYGPGLGLLGPAMLTRVGFWTLAIALPIALAGLVWRAVREHDVSARALVVPALLLPALFALLIYLKLVNYTLTELPLFALAIAWLATRLWRQPGRPALVRPVLAALLLAVVAEGALALASLERAATVTTPYPAFIARVRQAIAPGARILALHTYWFGLEDHDVRSFLVPIMWADPQSQSAPQPLDEGLDRIGPDVVLLDPRLRDYFATDGARDGAQFDRWLERRQARLIDQIDDPTYGRMDVYQVDGSS
jgi:4-amino-4-deoxy-L-arabinose transferase-like glycosyltransferase